MLKKEYSIGVIGLGYVGLPLCVELAKHFSVLGYDIQTDRIDELSVGFDKNNEVNKNELVQVTDNLTLSCCREDLKQINFYIVAVPTPVTRKKEPDISGLLSATKLVGEFLGKGDVVVFESTVYPGCTEDECIPILEEESGLSVNRDFYCGYSPERINPADKAHTIRNIVKVISGSSKKAVQLIDQVYSTIVDAGTYVAPDIKTAEAAKIIENVQRDINIAFVNELSEIFYELGIDTESVLNAASTKWNFLNFKPGLVGGHCIGVDPYYLAWKARKVGIQPKMILAGRNINESVSSRICGQLQKDIGIQSIGSTSKNVLIMGYTFKENCNDVRNSQVEKILMQLIQNGFDVDVCDPVLDINNSQSSFNRIKEHDLKSNFYDAVILTIRHDIFVKWGVTRIKSFLKKDGVFYDLKSVFDASHSNFRL